MTHRRIPRTACGGPTPVSPRRGFTLFETLLVVSLLALGAALAAGRLTGATAAAERLSAAAAAQDIDRLARLHALTGGAVEMRLEPSAVVVERGSTRLARRALPAGFSLAFEGATPFERRDRITVDAGGRSDDYRIVLLDPTGRRAAWTVRGLTGWIEPLSDEEPMP